MEGGEWIELILEIKRWRLSLSLSLADYTYKFLSNPLTFSLAHLRAATVLPKPSGSNHVPRCGQLSLSVTLYNDARPSSIDWLVPYHTFHVRRKPHECPRIIIVDWSLPCHRDANLFLSIEISRRGTNSKRAGMPTTLAIWLGHQQIPNQSLHCEQRVEAYCIWLAKIPMKVCTCHKILCDRYLMSVLKSISVHAHPNKIKIETSPS